MNKPPPDPPSDCPQQNKLPIVLLWVPIWLALLVLGWLIQSKYYPEESLTTFNAIAEPIVVDGVNENITLLKSDNRGQYIFSGFINDKKVKFLLDTGATTVAIPEHMANYLHLGRGSQYMTMTANGMAPAFNTLIKDLRVGNIQLAGVQGALLPGMQGDVVLLGMSFLKDLEIIQKSGEISLVQDKIQK